MPTTLALSAVVAGIRVTMEYLANARQESAQPAAPGAMLDDAPFAPGRASAVAGTA